MNARPVLLIDHDAEWCARVCQFLEPHGIPVVAASSVAGAVEHLQHSLAPSAVLLDISERGGNPAESLRQDATLRDVPIGYLRKSAALDALLLMLPSSPTGARPHAA